MFLKWKPVCIVLTVLLLSGCGLGTAGLVAAGNGGGGGSTPTITSFEVLNPKVSPATLRLEASQAVLVELFYARPGVGTAAMMELSGPGVSGNQVQLPSGATDLVWNFEAELGGPEFVADVDLFARHPNGASISGGTLHLGMGNDPPVMLLVEPMPTDPANPGESSGNVEVRLGVRDSSSDVVAIEMEWRRASDAPDAWQLATAAGVFPTGIETNRIGVELSFFWNTNVDLADGDDDVLLRATADDGTLDENNDPIGVGEPLESGLLHIDNNDAPIVQFDSGPVLSNTDERRGILIPYRVIDAEGDPVEMIFQWRRQGEEFPKLPASDPAAIDAILADPVLRREAHVCTPFLRYAGGRAAPIDAESIRLPELASTESWILANGMVGRTLELLRPSSIPQPISQTWPANPLQGPVSALAAGDGLTALVLDVPGGNGRLREIELSTGRIVREVATLAPGLPTAMAYELGQQAVLVASDLGVWRLDRIDLATGDVVELFASDASTEPAPVRGLASLGSGVALVTAGSSLLHLDYRDPMAPRLGAMRRDFAGPWGVAVDPIQPDRVYVGESDADRIVAFEIDSHGDLPVVVHAETLPIGELDRPQAIALERNGSRMLIVTDGPGGAQQLVGLDLGALGQNKAFPIGEPQVGPIASMASGPEGLRLLALPDQDEILVAGGVDQRRVITAYQPHMARVDPPFDPQPSPGQPWRLRDDSRLRRSAPEIDAQFLWDSADAGGEPAFLQAMARDTEFGLEEAGQAAKTVRSPFGVEPLVLGNVTPDAALNSVALADLDGDGDLDIVLANFETALSIFFQDSAGVFDPAPLVLQVPPGSRPFFVTAADLDGDGLQDVVSSNSYDPFTGASGNLTLFFQEVSGTFTTLVLDPSIAGSLPGNVAIADLDGDADMDIAVGKHGIGVLALYKQVAPREYDPPQVIDESFPRLLVAADLDGDSDMDLAGSREDGSLVVLFQSSSGAFDPETLPALAFAAQFLTAADVDGDGGTDLILGNGKDSPILLYQRAPGRFELSPLDVDPPFLSPPWWVGVADCDGDGDKDLVAPDPGSGGISILYQTTVGKFERVDGLAAFVTRGAVGDVDGDGAPDVVVAGLGNSVLVFFQRGAAGFDTTPLVLGGFSVTHGPWDVNSCDLDGDGDQDLLASNSDGVSDELTAFYQVAPRSFEPMPIHLGFSSRSIDSADFDGDGDQDIVAAYAEGDSLTVLLQLEPGVFDPTYELAAAAMDYPTLVRAADIDNDGYQDVLSANPTSSNLTLFFQDPPGGFDPTPVSLATSSIQELVLSPAGTADLDGDGDLDVFALSYPTGGQLTLFYQTAPRVFEPTSLTVEGVPPIIAGDFDSDGRMDLAFAFPPAQPTEPGIGISILLQDAQGNFGPRPISLGEGKAVIQLAAEDLDQDGDMDLVSAHYAPDIALSLHFQTTPGIFRSSSIELSFGFQPQAMFPRDLDGDGDHDLVVGEFYANLLSILWGGN